MNLYRIEQKRPKDGEWYVVYCPDYCESGYQIAKWEDSESYWQSEGFSPVNDYVKAYFTTPISEW